MSVWPNGSHVSTTRVKEGDWVGLKKTYEVDPTLKLLTPQVAFNWRKKIISDEDVAFMWGCYCSGDYAKDSFARLKVNNLVRAYVMRTVRRFGIREVYFNPDNDDYTIVEIYEKKIGRYFALLGDQYQWLRGYPVSTIKAYLLGIFCGGDVKFGTNSVLFRPNKDIEAVQDNLLCLGIPTDRSKRKLTFIGSLWGPLAFELGISVDLSLTPKEVMPNFLQVLYDVYNVEKKRSNDGDEIFEDFVPYFPSSGEDLTRLNYLYLSEKYKSYKNATREFNMNYYFYDVVEAVL